jgi:hypothetical protein
LTDEFTKEQQQAPNIEVETTPRDDQDEEADSSASEGFPEFHAENESDVRLSDQDTNLHRLCTAIAHAKVSQTTAQSLKAAMATVCLCFLGFYFHI